MATAKSTDRALNELEAEDLRRRLAVLEQELGKDRADKRQERLTREELEAGYCVNGPRDAGPPPAPGSFSDQIMQAQRRGQERRQRDAERQAAAHAEQLVKVAPKVAQLEADITGFESQAAEVRRKRDAELAEVSANILKCRREIDRLQELPEIELEPNPDAVEMVPFYRDGSRTQYATREVVAAAEEARRMGLSGPDVQKYLVDTGVVDASFLTGRTGGR